jgi:hypothetical protein
MFGQIDWSRPWYDAVRPAFSRLGPIVDGAPIAPVLNEAASAAALPVRFVPQSELPEGTAYEAHIGATGCVPTRDNLHDFFNALVWLTFPRIKKQLNTLQAAQIAQAGIGKSRGPARDAATIFDENAALLVVGPDGAALVDALRAHQWQEALWERRAQWGRDVELWPFGHALMEKLVAPRKAITAHVRVLAVDESFFALDDAQRRARIDELVAAELASRGLDTGCFTPLQALGVPGWWPGQDPDFYADTSVFRPKREKEHQ